MDAFLVAFRIPNLLRDLFAEGAMSAAFVPTFTRDAHDRRARRAWRLGNARHQRAARRDRRRSWCSASCSPSRWCRSSPARLRDVPGKLELTVLLTRIMLPFLTLVAVAAAFMGMLNSLHHFFVPALSPAMFNVATIACAFVLVPLMPALGLPPIAGDRDRHAARRRWRRSALQWPALRREGFRYHADARLARSRRCGACCC